MARSFLPLLLAAACLGGCAYGTARLNDLRDVARVGLELGPQFGVHAEAGALLHTGLGFGLVPATVNTGVGLMGRHTPIKYHLQCFDLVYVHYRAIDGHPENLCSFSPLFPGRTPTHNPREYHPIDWLDTEVAVYCVLGARVGVNPGQLVDFVAGLFTLDPAGDDIVPADRPPPTPRAARAPPLPREPVPAE
ncbi:MAG: hypothetical protein JXQ29_05275 [Planctomycetes bacterium]|nr:hypothetical protein [Planctomycetota bacterium]